MMKAALHTLILLGAAMAALGGVACAAPSDASEADAEQGDDALIGGKAASATSRRSGCSRLRTACSTRRR
jgi:hypothetical protein